MKQLINQPTNKYIYELIEYIYICVYIYIIFFLMYIFFHKSIHIYTYYAHEYSK